MYLVNNQVIADIKNRFLVHNVDAEQAERMQEIRAKTEELAKFFCYMCVPSRELSLALTNLEQSVFWVEAGIMRNEGHA